MPKISWNCSSLFSEIKKLWHDINFRSRRPSSRMAPTQLPDADINARLLLDFTLKSYIAPDGSLNEQLLSQQDQEAALPPHCHYCHQPCQVSTHYHLDHKGQIKGWKCDQHAHSIEYLAIPDATYYAFYFTVWLDQHEYSIEAYKLPQGEQWELREGSKTILHLNYIPPKLTPDNIDGRLKTLILFS